MSSIEGGDFKCGRHNFQTASVKKWNEHMTEKPHSDIVIETKCIECGAIIRNVEIPFQEIQPDGAKNISLKCDKCEGKRKSKK